MPASIETGIGVVESSRFSFFLPAPDEHATLVLLLLACTRYMHVSIVGVLVYAVLYSRCWKSRIRVEMSIFLLPRQATSRDQTR